MNRPLLLGHRGARSVRSIPENTIASFDRALSDGCDGFEFDVRLTRDGDAVVFHDEKMRLTRIAHATAARLSRLPRLQDVLQRYQNSAFLNIELKVAGIEEVAASLLQKYPPARGYIVSSFLPEVLWSLHAMLAEIRLGLICENEQQLSLWSELPMQSVMTHRKLATPDTISKLKKAGKDVFVWTVNDAHEMLQFAEFGVAGIISDKTDLLSRTLRLTEGPLADTRGRDIEETGD